MYPIAVRPKFRRKPSGGGGVITPGVLFGADLIGLFEDADLHAALSGSNVTQWNDTSGVGNHIAPNFGGSPTYSATGLGGKPAVIFSAANADRLNRTSVAFGSTTAVSMFMLGSFTANSVASGLCIHDSAGTKIGMAALGSGTTGIQALLGFGSGVVQAASINTILRMVVVFDGTNAITYVNNVANGTPFSAALAAIGTATNFGFNIEGVTSCHDGAARVMGFVKRAITPTERASLDTYLVSRA